MVKVTWPDGSFSEYGADQAAASLSGLGFGVRVFFVYDYYFFWGVGEGGGGWRARGRPTLPLPPPPLGFRVSGLGFWLCNVAGVEPKHKVVSKGS